MYTHLLGAITPAWHAQFMQLNYLVNQTTIWQHTRRFSMAQVFERMNMEHGKR